MIVKINTNLKSKHEMKGLHITDICRNKSDFLNHVQLFAYTSLDTLAYVEFQCSCIIIKIYKFFKSATKNSKLYSDILYDSNKEN